MAETEDDPFALIGRRLENKYEVSEVVAEGGFGVVYRARHLGLDKQVALKVLKSPPDLAGPMQVAYLEKFAQEARLIAALEHPAIVRVLDFGVSPLQAGMATPWMALEWLEGTTLEAHLDARSGHGEDPREVFARMEQVIDAIACAHEDGIVHRDLKPANLMLVANRRGEPAVKVLDFGIAKAVSPQESVVDSSGATRTRSELVAFSPHYAAPEQLTGMRTGPATDVHALALILVEMLCGQPAYGGNDLSEIYASALAPVRPTPAAHGTDVGAWEPVLARALAFKPADRFANARKFLDALRGALAGARHLVVGGDRAPVTEVTDDVATLRGAAMVVPTQAARSRSRSWIAALAVGLVALSIITVETRLRHRPGPVPAARRDASAEGVRPVTSPPTPPAAAIPETVAAPALLAPSEAPVDAGTRVAPLPSGRPGAVPVGRRRRPATTGSVGAGAPGVAESAGVSTVPVE